MGVFCLYILDNNSIGDMNVSEESSFYEACEQNSPLWTSSSLVFFHVSVIVTVPLRVNEIRRIYEKGVGYLINYKIFFLLNRYLGSRDLISFILYLLRDI